MTPTMTTEGARKAAIVLIKIGREKATTVLAHLSEAEVELITSEIAQLESVAPAESNVVLLEGHEITAETREMFRADLPEFNPELIQEEVRRQHQSRAAVSEVGA